MALGLPPGWLRDTAALYARVFRRGAELALRNWWVGLVVIVYSVLLGVVAVVTAPLGLVGGLLAYLALVACFSSWLALVAQVIQTGRIRLEDVPTSFATYFGDLLNVGFVFWGLQLIWTYVLAPVPFVQIVFGLAVFVFLNAVPELVYVGRRGAVQAGSRAAFLPRQLRHPAGRQGVRRVFGASAHPPLRPPGEGVPGRHPDAGLRSSSADARAHHCV